MSGVFAMARPTNHGGLEGIDVGIHNQLTIVGPRSACQSHFKVTIQIQLARQLSLLELLIGSKISARVICSCYVL